MHKAPVSIVMFLSWLTITAQPVAQWSLALRGLPVSCFVRPGSGTLVVTSERLSYVDSNGSVMLTDSLWPISASTMTAQGNILIAGNRDTAGYSIPYVRLLNPSLREIWRQSLFPNSIYEQRVKNIHDNGMGRIFLSGSARDTTSSNPQTLCYFAGLDSTGSVYWSFPYAIGTSDDYFVKSVLDHSGNLIIGLNVEQINASTGEMHFRKYDPNGTFLFENLFYPVFAKDVMTDLTVGSVNQTFLTGSFNLTSFMGNTLSALAVFDSSGLLASFTPYDGYGYDGEQHIITNGNGAVYCSVSGTDMLVNHDRHTDVLKFDENGTLLWQRRHDSLSTVYETAYCINQSSDGGPVIAGATRQDTLNNEEGLLVAYDTTGELRYEVHHVSPGNDLEFRQLAAVNDTDFYSLGISTGSGGTSQTLLVHWQMLSTGLDETASQQNQLQIYPNPCSEWIRLKGPFNACQALVYDMLGNEVLRQFIAPGSTIPTSSLPVGCYTLALKSTNGIWYRKFMKQ